MKACPNCSKSIPATAVNCAFCGVAVVQSAAPSNGPRGRSRWELPRAVLTVCEWSLVLFVVCVVTVTLLPTLGNHGDGRRSRCKNNLKQIGLALYSYHDEHGTFPPAYFADASGRPIHSWRVLLLPYVDQQALYNQYKWDEPWDGPNNSRLMAQIPPVFRCPSHAGTPGDTTTAYAAVFGDDCVFRSSGSTRMADITDGTSNTILVGEVERAGIPWMKPEDVDVSKHPTIGDPAGFSSLHIGGIHVLLADGSVRFISENISPATLRGLYTRAGNEQIGDY